MSPPARVIAEGGGCRHDAPSFRRGIVAPAADSFHAPQVGFGDVEFYPDIYDKAAVVVCRLAWNHPLPDQAEEAMLAIAGGDVNGAGTAA